MISPNSDFWPNSTQYDIDCEIINKLAGFILYNFKTKGEGQVSLFGGNITDLADPARPTSFSLLPKRKLKKNSYNFYEVEIDLDNLKM